MEQMIDNSLRTGYPEFGFSGWAWPSR